VFFSLFFCFGFYVFIDFPQYEDALIKLTFYQTLGLFDSFPLFARTELTESFTKEA